MIKGKLVTEITTRIRNDDLINCAISTKNKN